MYKVVALVSLLVAVANAGFISPIAYHAPLVAAPVAVKATVPVATSYQSQVQISHGAVPIAVAPVIKAPVIAAPAFAAPAIVKTPVFASPAIVKTPFLHFDHY